MSHELSFSVEIDGKHYLLPSVINGKQVERDVVVKLFKAGKIEAFGVYDSEAAATAAAKARSNEYRRPSLLGDIGEQSYAP